MGTALISHRQAVPVVLLALAAAGGCSSSGDGPATTKDTVTVAATDTTCTVTPAGLTPGPHVFNVTNSGSEVTEFYVYGSDGRIVGEVENVAPGLSRELRVDLPVGAYQAVCKPGMAGDGIRQAMTVAGAAASTPSDPTLAAATEAYQQYVRRQADELLSRTRAWVALVKSGDLRAAKDGFAATRAPYERIEPVAESFADLDKRIDARDSDLEPGATWAGFHRLEKDLWQGHRPPAAVAEGLLADVTALHQRLATQTFRPLEVAGGAKSLLDEVAAKKVTGEEDRYSHTDLSDFAANVDGCRAAIDALRPAVTGRDNTVLTQIDERLATVDRLLAQQRTAGRYVAYSALDQSHVRELSDAINALAEPVSRLGAVLSQD